MTRAMTSAKNLAALVSLIALLPAAPGIAADAAPSISPQALSERLGGGDAPVVLDVRTRGEFASGHIPGAINIPHNELLERIAELQPGDELAIYCMKGPRARLGEQTLRSAGRDRLLHVQGGLLAWQAAGLPVEKK